jgi:hypothetical protein
MSWQTHILFQTSNILIKLTSFFSNKDIAIELLLIYIKASFLLERLDSFQTCFSYQNVKNSLLIINTKIEIFRLLIF